MPDNNEYILGKADVKLEEKRLVELVSRNRFIRVFVSERCEDVTDETLKMLAANCNLTHLCIREGKYVEAQPLDKMPNLTTLILVECPRVHPYRL